CAALVPPEARRSRRVVSWPQQTARERSFVAIGRVHVLDDLTLVPDVVAGSDDINAELEQFLGYLRCDAKAPSGILPVGDGELHAVQFLQLGQPFVDDGAPWTAENVSNEEYAQGAGSP